MLRRFENFRMGALTAGRLNAMIDAIESLQRDVRRQSAEGMAARPVILCKITSGGTLSNETCSDPRVVRYRFKQVFFSRTPSSPIGSASCTSVVDVPGGLQSDSGSELIEFSEVANYKSGDIVAAAHIHGAMQDADDPAQMVYTIISPKAGKGAMRLARITEAMGGQAYKGQILGSQPPEIVEFVNIYEVEEFYGASNASIECADVTANLLSVGNVVWVQEVQGESGSGSSPYSNTVFVTCAPNSFNSECTCGPTSGVAAARLVIESRGVGADAEAASLIMQRVMQPI